MTESQQSDYNYWNTQAHKIYGQWKDASHQHDRYKRLLDRVKESGNEANEFLRKAYVRTQHALPNCRKFYVKGTSRNGVVRTLEQLITDIESVQKQIEAVIEQLQTKEGELSAKCKELWNSYNRCLKMRDNYYSQPI